MVGNLPLVTILMPVRNEAAFIERSLEAVLAQDYDHDRLEIVLIDGMSTDGTREYIRQVIDSRRSRCGHARLPPIRLLDNPSRIVPHSMNIGLSQSCGSIIVRIDGHCLPATDYVSRCVEALMNSGADCVGGCIITAGATYTARAIAIAQSSIFGVGGAAFRVGVSSPQYVDTVAFGAYSRVVFERIGPFDEEMVRNQDDELNYRLVHSGGRIWLDPSIGATYYSRASLPRLFRQYFQYGFWKVRVMQKHPHQMRLRHFAPPAFVAALLAGTALTGVAAVGLKVLLVLLSVYAFANSVASLQAARRMGWRYVVLIPLAFATLHLSYGSGFLVGLVRFWDRWGRKRGLSNAKPGMLHAVVKHIEPNRQADLADE